MITIKRALVSVADKSGLAELAALLKEFEVEVVSTGGTATALRAHLPEVTEVSELTKFPEILGGRVKTLHPHVHGGILARKDRAAELQTLKELHLRPYDLVVVNLYPFAAQLAAATAKPTADATTRLLEYIDIGGITLLRAAAKNYQNVVLITEPADYQELAVELHAHQGSVSSEFTAARMAAAFRLSSAYDRQIAEYFSQALPATSSAPTPTILAQGFLKQQLRYGENPHQQAALYVHEPEGPGIAQARLLNGKPLSYNNLCDAAAAWRLSSSLTEPACVVVKHSQPCGVALQSSQSMRQQDTSLAARAFAADQESAFGGVVAFNHELTEQEAAALVKLFLEVIVAPSFTPAALAQLSAKKNLRLLAAEPTAAAEPQIKNISGGFLRQSADTYVPTAESLKWVAGTAPTELRDVLFAWQVVKFCHSNAIVIAKDGVTCGIGAGQTSRVFSVKAALQRAAQNGFDLSEAVAASDAFFPFPDSLELLAASGIKTIIQPGGSLADPKVIAAAQQLGVNLAFTGIRAFYHG